MITSAGDAAVCEGSVSDTKRHAYCDSTLNPIPYTLHPIPSSLHNRPYTLDPDP